MTRATCNFVLSTYFLLFLSITPSYFSPTGVIPTVLKCRRRFKLTKQCILNNWGNTKTKCFELPEKPVIGKYYKNKFAPSAQSCVPKNFRWWQWRAEQRVKCAQTRERRIWVGQKELGDPQWLELKFHIILSYICIKYEHACYKDCLFQSIKLN